MTTATGSYVGRVDALVGVGIVALVASIYWPTVGFEFLIWDDDGYILRNVRVRHGLSWESLTWAFTAFEMSNWHPITWISYLADASMFGDWAGGFHLTNVVWHAINGLLLYALFRRLTGEVWRSALVAALFAVHPLHVESVAWISERKDVLSTAFGLMALHAYVSYARGASIRRYALVAALFAASLMSKPMLVTLPAVLVLFDYWPLGRAWPGSWLRLIAEKLPLLGLSLASSALTLLAQHEGGAMRSLEQVAFADRLGNAMTSYATYLGKALWPSGLAFFQVFSAPTPLGIAGAFCAMAALTFWVLRARSGNPALVVGWLWFLGTLVPVIGVVQVGDQGWASRYAYVPFVGLYIMLAWALPTTGAAPRSGIARAAAVAGAIAILGLSVRAGIEARHWRNSEALFARALEVNPENFVAHTLLARLFSERGNAEAAQRHANAALTVSGGRGFAAQSVLLTLSRVYMDGGRHDLAGQALDKAEAIGPRSPVLHYNRGTLALLRGDAAGSIRHFDRAIDLNPRYSEALNNRGAALARMGRLEQAVEDHRRAVSSDPYNFHAHYNLGAALEAVGAREQALAAFSESVAIAPRDVRPRLRIASLLSASGRNAEARSQYESVLAIDPANGAARRALAHVQGR